MKTPLFRAIALATVAGVVLAGCGTGREGAAGDEAAGGAEGGFDADARIGVALPDKTSENWVLAGDLFVDDLEEAGFTPDVQYAGGQTPVQDQQAQIEAMISNGAQAIVIGAADTGQLASQVQAAKDAGIQVIAYDRLIQDTENIDYYIAFDNYQVGELQGQALLDGMAERFGEQDSYNIELFSGSPDDSNAPVFFEGAMSVLQEKIDDGTLNVVSGQTELSATATQDWLAENAQERMDNLIQGNYSDGTELHGVLSPNDTLARAILASASDAGLETPVVTGQDSEVESVRSIMAGEQYSTISKDTRLLVAQTVELLQTLQAGEEPADAEPMDNGAAEIPSVLLEPVIVTQENAAEVYADDPNLAPLTE
ncbi:sugar-binding protein [Sediminivirga luteola]|uniref:Sugar ABC transporter substrate-binding protein n=1 Tax=Sediminivirga luteola TaxID=1774748 RepID=A0A8J2U109_9MICO|nr:sugar-binding protein [Sediminivirga luteola]MCI2264891.1 sugar-binding protein [Sediminivirga luteola]GGA26487.1 sugar ABC transporter substrate-binding protein [Sediminivirga luteola]